MRQVAAVTAAEAQRLDGEILSLRVALLGKLPAKRRSSLEAELQDLRMARLGIRTRNIRIRLDRLGIEGGRPGILWRGPAEWGDAH
jgi:hypothetical protein